MTDQAPEQTTEFGQLAVQYLELVGRQHRGEPGLNDTRKAVQREVIGELYRIARPFNNGLPDLSEVLRWWEEWDAEPECADEE